MLQQPELIRAEPIPIGDSDIAPEDWNLNHVSKGQFQLTQFQFKLQRVDGEAWIRGSDAPGDRVLSVQGAACRTGLALLERESVLD